MKTGKRIELLRTSLGLTQEHVAHYIGISREYISMIESGRREANLNHLEKLADLFGVDLEDLVNESSENVTTKASLAFRADEVSADDLAQISKFQQVIKNYLKMQSLLNSPGNERK
jgi:transcriptional regulator with XRE-family HTH domain